MKPEQIDTVDAASTLRVSVVCVRWNGTSLETVLAADSSIPAAAPAPGESLDATAARVVSSTLNASAAYMEQLYTFSTSYGAQREISVSYLALFAPDCTGQIPWVPIDQARASSDAQVVEYGMMRLRAKLEYTSIGFHLLPPTFTLADLQAAYESMLGANLDKRNFRRRMTTGGMLTDTGEKRREGPHRPASLYRFSGQADRSSYLTPPRQGDSE